MLLKLQSSKEQVGGGQVMDEGLMQTVLTGARWGGGVGWSHKVLSLLLESDSGLLDVRSGV